MNFLAENDRLYIVTKEYSGYYGIDIYSGNSIKLMFLPTRIFNAQSMRFPSDNLYITPGGLVVLKSKIADSGFFKVITLPKLGVRYYMTKELEKLPNAFFFDIDG